MSDPGGASFDPDLWSLVSFAEQSYQELEEMASGIEARSEEALAAEAEHMDLPCCQFAGRVTSSSLGGMNALLELALSDKSSEYSSLVFDCHMSVTAFFSLRALCLVSPFAFCSSLFYSFFFFFFGGVP